MEGVLECIKRAEKEQHIQIPYIDKIFLKLASIMISTWLYMGNELHKSAQENKE